MKAGTTVGIIVLTIAVLLLVTIALCKAGSRADELEEYYYKEYLKKKEEEGDEK